MFKEAFRAADRPGRAALLFSSFFGAGLVPKAPGTFGTIASLPLVWLMHASGPIGGALLILALTGLSVWAAGAAERALGRGDPPEVVADEAAGFMVGLYMLPFSWIYVAGGFVLFRVFDIVKPWPVRRAERLPGGAGVVGDDLLAGLYTNLALRAAGALLAAAG